MLDYNYNFISNTLFIEKFGDSECFNSGNTASYKLYPVETQYG
jgi:hypothetical protein